MGINDSARPHLIFVLDWSNLQKNIELNVKKNAGHIHLHYDNDHLKIRENTKDKWFGGKEAKSQYLRAVTCFFFFLSAGY